MKKILIVNGSYRENGITDQVLNTMQASLNENGAKTELIRLRDVDINFCLNCRECTQLEGTSPGQCVQDDDMHSLIEKIEAADAYILASPTNFGSATAIYKRFMERLVVYAYWPWGTPTPQYRKLKQRTKPAVLVSSSAAPGLMGRWMFGTLPLLRQTAKVIGAKPVGTLFTGLIAQQADQQISTVNHAKACKLAHRLL